MARVWGSVSSVRPHGPGRGQGGARAGPRRGQEGATPACDTHHVGELLRVVEVVVGKPIHVGQHIEWRRVAWLLLMLLTLLLLLMPLLALVRVLALS